MAEGTGLENRNTGNGIEGSNPSLSVRPCHPRGRLPTVSRRVTIPPVLNLLIVTQQAGTPGDCTLTGLCGLLGPERPVPPGVMFVAIGLVGFGVWGLWRRRLRRDG